MDFKWDFKICKGMDVEIVMKYMVVIIIIFYLIIV